MRLGVATVYAFAYSIDPWSAGAMGVDPAGDERAIQSAMAAGPPEAPMSMRGKARVVGSHDTGSGSPVRRARPNLWSMLAGADKRASIAFVATDHLVGPVVGAARLSSQASSETGQFIEPDASSKMKMSV